MYEVSNKMKKAIIFLSLIISISIALNSCTTENTKLNEKEKLKTDKNRIMMNMGHNKDKRISLRLNPQMKQHQLMNMRSHVEAVKTIINLLSDNQFDKAAKVAHLKLGLTDEMRKMCTSFENKDFTRMGLEFHASADKLGDILTTKDKNKSLLALSNTMSFCVNCHATFRQ